MQTVLFLYFSSCNYITCIGAVFSGKYRDREIAVKKVNDPKQTEIKHFRKLVHPNIIKFM